MKGAWRWLRVTSSWVCTPTFSTIQNLETSFWQKGYRHTDVLVLTTCYNPQGSPQWTSLIQFMYHKCVLVVDKGELWSSTWFRKPHNSTDHRTSLIVNRKIFNACDNKPRTISNSLFQIDWELFGLENMFFRDIIIGLLNPHDDLSSVSGALFENKTQHKRYP